MWGANTKLHKRSAASDGDSGVSNPHDENVHDKSKVQDVMNILQTLPL